MERRYVLEGVEMRCLKAYEPQALLCRTDITCGSFAVMHFIPTALLPAIVSLLKL